MERREILSFALPLLGLAFTVPEAARLLERGGLTDCISTQTDLISCESQGTILLLLMGVLSIVFLVRLIALALQHRR